MLFLQTLAFLVLGILFLILGLRGRYLGPEPRCRSCTYQLTGRLDAERCPECGAVLTPKTLVYGLRKPRWWSMITVVVVVAIFWAVPGRLLWKVRRIEWFEYYPVGMLLWRAKADQPHAIYELAWRAHRGELSSESSHEIAELALRKLDQWPLIASGRAWSGLLELMDEGGLLTDKQRERLFCGLVQASLSVRRQIRQGDPLVLRVGLSPSSRGHTGYVLWHGTSAVRVGDREIFKSPDDACRSSRGYDWAFIDRAPACNKTLIFSQTGLLIGQAQVDYAGRHVLHYRDWAWSNSSPEVDAPLWSKEITLTKDIEVLPANAPDPVRWVVPPEAESQLRDGIDLCLRMWLRDEWSRDEWYGWCVGEKEVLSGDVAPLERAENHEVLDIHLSLSDPPPIPVAFDLVIEADGSELETTTDVDRGRPSWGVCSGPSVLAWNREESGDAELTVKVPPFTANEVFVILRGSRDVARRTVDMYEVWQGELRFGPFRVEHSSP